MFSLVFHFGEYKYRVEVGIKGDNGIETLALLALEAFQQGGLPGGEQFFDFLVLQVTVGFLTEHGQTALWIVATHHLAVELHLPFAALGTGAAGGLVPEDYVAGEQFGGDFRGVSLYILMEGEIFLLPTLDACQFTFPLSR